MLKNKCPSFLREGAFLDFNICEGNAYRFFLSQRLAYLKAPKNATPINVKPKTRLGLIINKYSISIPRFFFKNAQP